MNKTIRNTFLLAVGAFALYLIGSLTWGVLNTQSCSSDLPENPTCEQIAENNAQNCKYVILRWKKVDYETELRECRAWEQEQNE
ncbi:MAG: hypothetical protein A3E36_02335 [Candidatus Andersenbacteria bacterium RIFCSPHIGHO2_12_FULL_45_11b]|uniref:Uncharacterized protein n=1 Tax=Candidatus Andersenbacteria bacterium RIFCSPHIGHO2_12_FULL_45_11b TaxID=1797282 RepID=A0A1G1XCV0_9BACT|nr:MAG: hypothetical protein A3E36_02335 [Candidatus Andersenbacteria bacterium RIFCSPHIGHO2_12_FULL_45_11b]